MQARPITGQLAKIASGPRATQDLARASAGIARGPNQKRLLNGAAWSGTWPSPGATLDFDFVNDLGYVRGAGHGRSMDTVTLTRASLARYVDKDGLLKTAYYYHPPSAYQETVATAISPNLFQYSNLFTDATWGKLGATVSVSGEQPPAGFSTCFQVTENSGALNRAAITRPSGTFTTGTTFSLYAKEIVGSSKRYLYLGMWSGAETRWCFAIFDIATGNITFRADGIQNIVSGGYIENVGNGWVRVSATISSPLASQTPAIGLTDNPSPTNAANLGGYTGDGASGMLIAGAQFESGAIVKTSPRFDWGNTVEIPFRNTIPYSEDFTARASLGNATYRAVTGLLTITGPAQINSTPFGNAAFTALTEDTSTGLHFLQIGRNLNDGITNWPGDPSTFSMLVKRGNRRYFAVRQYSSIPFNQAIFDFDNLSSVSFSSSSHSGAYLSATATNLGNDIIRITITTNAVGGGINSFLIMGCDDSGNVSYTGNGSIAIYVSAVQLEAGSSATDYQALGAFSRIASTPLAANPTCNGLLIEESRTNRLLWGRDATSGTGTNMLFGSASSVAFETLNGSIGSLGSEIISNGDFSGGSTGWVLGALWSISGGQAVMTAGTTGTLYQDIPALTVGKYYKLEYDQTWSGGTFGVLIRVGAAGAVLYNNNSPSTAQGRVSIIFYASAAATRVNFFTASNPIASGTIDNVSLKEVFSDGTIAPDTTATAATAIASSANATLLQPVSVSAGIHTFSVWLRRKTGTGNVDITCQSTGTWITQSITSSWARYSVTQSVTGTTTSCGIRITTASDEIEVWGPQLIPGSVLTNYQATTASAVFGWSRSNVTVAFNQTGIDGVVNAATSITATSNNGVLIQPVSLTSGSRTCSVYLKRITGTDPIQISLDGSTWSTTDLSSVQWRRFVLSGTLTNPTLGIRLITSGDAVAMDYGQIEDGAFATSPIMTTSTTATRALESATMPTTTAWYNPGAQTISASFMITNYVAGVGIGAGICAFGAFSPRVILTVGFSTGRPVSSQIFDGRGFGFGGGYITPFFDLINGVVHKVALSYDNANAQLSLNGISGLPVNSPYPYTLTPQPGASFIIGNRPDTNQPLNGWISSLKIFGKRTNTDTINILSGIAT